MASCCCWISDLPDPPWQWDLRRRGWTLGDAASQAADGPPLHLIDATPLDPAACAALPAGWPPAQLIVLGIDDPRERARLLGAGCAEVLARDTTLDELAERARRVVERAALLPRRRHVGPLVLDLFHRDARVGPTWLGLHPREFGLLWRLSDQPGEPITRRDLLRDVWRVHHEPETNSVEVHVSRLRSKLAGMGCEALIQTVSTGGYRLAPDAPLSRPVECAPAGAYSGTV